MGSNNTEYSFYVDQRYDLSRGKILGAGSFGVVCSAMDLVRQDRVAVKKVLAYCEDDWDARHALREIRLMRLMTPHPNVIWYFSFLLIYSFVYLWYCLSLYIVCFSAGSIH